MKRNPMFRQINITINTFKIIITNFILYFVQLFMTNKEDYLGLPFNKIISSFSVNKLSFTMGSDQCCETGIIDPD